MTRWWSFLLCLLLLVGARACKESSEPEQAPRGPAPAGSASSTAQANGRCEHGLPKALCTKCNPSLVPVFKAKGDWCEEHGVPESQCKLCNPDLKIERPPKAGAR